MIEKKAALFDFDGTLVNSDKPWQLSLKEQVLEYGIDFLEEHQSELMAMGNMFEYLEGKFDIKIEDKPRFQARLYESYSRLAVEEVTLVPGVITTLKRLSPHYDMAIGTSSRTAEVEAITTKFKIRDYFKTIIGGDLVTNHKPSPDVYLRVADNLEIPPCRCVVIEDSLNGLTAAKGAGMKCIVIPSSTDPKYDYSAADLKLNKISQITLPVIEELFK